LANHARTKITNAGRPPVVPQHYSTVRPMKLVHYFDGRDQFGPQSPKIE
jgi:hypothetical protein